MRIDTHAHAFPGLDYLARAWPEPLQRAAGAGVALAGWLQKLRSGAPPRVSVERLASMRTRGPRRLHQALEMTAGLAMLPALATRASLEDLYVSMDAHGIDRTVVIAAWPSAPNDWLLPAARASAGRIVPVAHPVRLSEHDPEDTWTDAYAALWEDGARGFKIHHNMDGLDPNSRAYRTMFEVASSTGSFVIVHTGCFNVIGYKHQRPATPALFERYFEEYPDVRVCLAHMNRDHPEEAWGVVRKFDNVFVDTSWQPVEAVRRAIAEVGAERVLLGSDWPLLHADLQGDCVSVIERAATDAEQAIIFDSAARRFIGE